MENEEDRKECGLLAFWRYTWAGQNEAFACPIHAAQLQNVARAIGYPLQLIELDEEVEKFCNNKVK